jgi:DNA-3-methyladenine glycosylase
VTEQTGSVVGHLTIPDRAEFFGRDAVAVARELIGSEFLVAGVGGILVETEAYALADPASHSFRGQTARNAPMFGKPGTAYVYRSYGLHWCMNIVCEPGNAVLLRALAPMEGIVVMQERRCVETLRLLASGPGRLSSALGIDASFNTRAVTELPFSLKLDRDADVVTGTRIGISRATHLPWRFGLAGSRFVSRPFSAPQT